MVKPLTTSSAHWLCIGQLIAYEKGKKVPHLLLKHTTMRGISAARFLPGGQKPANTVYIYILLLYMLDRRHTIMALLPQHYKTHYYGATLQNTFI